MEKGRIGFNAGFVLSKLEKIGLITIPELARRLHLSFDDTILAIGWLAREGKVFIKRHNGLLYVRKE